MNLQSIIISNVIGFAIVVTVLISSHLVRQRRLLSDKLLTTMLILTGFSCLDEMSTFILDGTVFWGSHALRILMSTLLYTSNMVNSFLWCLYTDLRLYQSESRIKKNYLVAGIPVLVGVLVLLVNIFTGIVFNIDADGIYHRGVLCNAYYVSILGYLLFSAVIYLRYRRNTGQGEFFPIGMFLTPILIGATAQVLVYGISIGWCSVAIGLAGIYMSLQNELSYVDNLTKLYNRSYLNQVISEIERKKMLAGGVMIDIDYFKTINDVYGHAEGDQALIKTAEILRRATPSKGIPVRFAGDEFIIILRNVHENDILTLKNNIREVLKEFNNETEKPYKLSFSIGHSMYYGVPDAFLTQMDERMYEEKKRNTARDNKKTVPL